jgi:hypothetical protein
MAYAIPRRLRPAGYRALARPFPKGARQGLKRCAYVPAGEATVMLRFV